VKNTRGADTSDVAISASIVNKFYRHFRTPFHHRDLGDGLAEAFERVDVHSMAAPITAANNMCGKAPRNASDCLKRSRAGTGACRGLA
jgi:hypothetical protein